MFNKRGLWAFLMTILILFISDPLPAAATPELVGEAAALIDSRNGQFLFEKNSAQRMYPASTTKILTAIIALERGRLDDLVCIPGDACNIEGSATGLQEGERISLEDLLYALMLNSGNDTAVAIAHHIGGSVEEFVRMMNTMAETIGANNSHFTNPNGLPDPDHYSTAHDMALIAHYAMQNPEFRKIVATPAITIQREVPGAQTYLDNHNKLLWNYNGAIGIKTGYTNDARQCLVSAAARQGRELIAVVLKSEGNYIWSDTITLLDYGFNEFKNVSLIEAGKYVADTRVRSGVSDTVPAQTGFSLTYNLPVDNRQEVRQKIFLDNSIVAPVKAGAKIGELAFYAGDSELGRVDLVAQNGIERKVTSRWWLYLIPALGLMILVLIVRYHNLCRRKRWMRYKRQKKQLF